MDGSAASFVYLLQQAGLEEQDAPSLWLNVDTLVHATVEECSGAAFELPFPSAQYCIVQVKVQGEI